MISPLITPGRREQTRMELLGATRACMLNNALLIESEPYGSFERPYENSLIWYSLIPVEFRPVSATD